MGAEAAAARGRFAISAEILGRDAGSVQPAAVTESLYQWSLLSLVELLPPAQSGVGIAPADSCAKSAQTKRRALTTRGLLARLATALQFFFARRSFTFTVLAAFFFAVFAIFAAPP